MAHSSVVAESSEVEKSGCIHHRIDVHHHVSPPASLTAMKLLRLENPLAANWSVEKTLQDMESGGIATAITSPSPPHVYGLNSDDSSRLARDCNEFAKTLEVDHPGRFGTFAILPFPHIDECLKELEYAFDVLHVDGVGCLTSYGNMWLGYAEFEPVWEELNRRHAKVYTHPVAPQCCVNLVRGIDEPLIEFGADTTRAIFTVIFSGLAERYPDIDWIWSHGGGALTAFYERFTVQALRRPPYSEQFTSVQIVNQIRRFFYDTAAVANEVTLSALTKMLPVSQILYGSDFPYRSAIEQTNGIAAFFSEGDSMAVERRNALCLFPRFQS